MLTENWVENAFLSTDSGLPDVLLFRNGLMLPPGVRCTGTACKDVRERRRRSVKGTWFDVLPGNRSWGGGKGGGGSCRTRGTNVTVSVCLIFGSCCGFSLAGASLGVSIFFSSSCFVFCSFFWMSACLHKDCTLASLNATISARSCTTSSSSFLTRLSKRLGRFFFIDAWGLSVACIGSLSCLC